MTITASRFFLGVYGVALLFVIVTVWSRNEMMYEYMFSLFDYLFFVEPESGLRLVFILGLYFSPCKSYFMDLFSHRPLLFG